jgi:hypothetical protein
VIELTSNQATLSAAARWARVSGEPTDQQDRRIRSDRAGWLDSAGLATGAIRRDLTD